ncbi:TIM barrel protein [Marmoricola sp. URHB0036]|uniref:TIM barrel protein n=1 Tax=Marmoricola sp. URHB0036 TaxID=1298863 RepID=UPI00040FF178|nr:TIM barrel protein [Marmoricola sp. URHB0036]
MSGPRSLSVNLEYMFREAGDDLAARVRAASAAGFDKAEIFWTHDKDLNALGAALDETGVQLWTVLVDPRTTRLVLEETHDGFLEDVRRTVADAVRLRCPNVVVGSGPAVPYLKRPVQIAIMTDAVARAAEIAADSGVTLLVEAVNTRMDHPGVLTSQTADSVAVVRGVGSPHVRVLYDLYHSVVEGEDPASVLPEVADLVGHVQIADAPGRGEPGTGDIDWHAAFALLDAVGYAGPVGIECYPTVASTADALAYVRTVAGVGSAVRS